MSGEGGLSRYLDQIRKFPMLEPQEEYMPAKRYLEHEDRDAAHKLVTSHLRLVARTATTSAIRRIKKTTADIGYFSPKSISPPSKQSNGPPRKSSLGTCVRSAVKPRANPRASRSRNNRN
jgi:hypothetical protein